MSSIQRQALKNAFFTAIYVVCVGTFMYFGGQAKIGQSNVFLLPITILLLLVTSASITGYLIFGKPVQLYIDSKKKEALSLLKYTLIYFSTITFVAMVCLIFFTRK